MTIATSSVNDATRRRALLTSDFFRAMRPDELDALIRLASERRFAQGATIFQKGDPGSSMMAILKGRVRVSVLSIEGKEITLSVLNEGEIFGEIALLDGKPRSADVTAALPTVALVIEQRQFLPFLMKNEELLKRLLSVLCGRLRQTSMALEDLALSDVQTRLARLLLKLTDDYGRPSANGLRIDVRMSQRDMSTLVAASRESVNKQLRQWREAGVLGIEGGYVVLFRPNDLRDLLGNY